MIRRATRRYEWLCLLALPFVALGCVGEDPETLTLATQIDSIVQAKFEAGEFHGGLLVARGDNVLYRGAVGMADRAEGVPNTPETPYPIHSITKPFTAVIILQLVNEGVLDLSGSLQQYVPDYGGIASDQITLHHLLSHTSGIPDYLFAIPGYLGPEPPNLPRDSVLTLIGSMPLEFEPGAGFGYSNTGYVLLARVIEEVTGKSLAVALEERIFDPLGMSDSHWQDTEVGEGIAVQYRGDGEAPVGTLFPGEAGIVSTLDDMHRFASALGSDQLLPAAMWELAFTPHGLPENATRFHPAHGSPYGYGFGLPEALEMRVVQHGGLGSGGTTMLQRDINGDGILLLWNNVDGMTPFLPAVFGLLVSG